MMKGMRFDAVYLEALPELASVVDEKSRSTFVPEVRA